MTLHKGLDDLPHVTIPEDYAFWVGPYLAECYEQHSVYAPATVRAHNAQVNVPFALQNSFGGTNPRIVYQLGGGSDV